MSDALQRPLGHEQVRLWLRNVIAARRASGGYLFVGPDGIGKAAVALEFAAALRCEAPVDNWSCGRCNECRRIAKGVHPSVRSFAKPDDKAAFPVELVRDIVDEASKRRLEPGMRLFIVADADRFNDSSANAFLKTLEEPPADLVFVLLAGNLAQVLPTILSRCQAVRFAPLADAQVAEVSRGWEGLPVNLDRRAELIRAAQGSPGRLRRMLDDNVLETARGFLAAVKADPFAAAEILSQAVQGGDDNEARRVQLREIIALLTAELRGRMLADLRNADGIVAAITRLDDLRELVDGNANLKLCCDAIALNWPELNPLA